MQDYIEVPHKSKRTMKTTKERLRKTFLKEGWSEIPCKEADGTTEDLGTAYFLKDLPWTDDGSDLPCERMGILAVVNDEGVWEAWIEREWQDVKRPKNPLKVVDPKDIMILMNAVVTAYEWLGA